MDKDGPISREEMVELFGSEMPIEAVNLLFGSAGGKTCGELRAELRAIAESRPSSDKLEEEMARAIADSLKRDCISTTSWECYAHVDEGVGYDGAWNAEVDGEIDLMSLAQACAVIARKQVEELEAALEATIPALEGQIESLLRSYTNLIGPDKGKVTDPDGVAWIAEFQEPLDKARAALHRKGVEPKCCNGGPQWGHALDCPKCPE